MKIQFAATMHVALIPALLLCACSSDLKGASTRETAKERISATGESIDENGKRLLNAKSADRPSNIAVRNGIYLGRHGFRTGNGDPLPPKYETADGVTMNLPGKIGLVEFVLGLRKLTGMRVDYGDIAATPDSLFMDSMDAQTEVGINSQASENADSGDFSDHPVDVKFRVDYTGPLSGLLDHVSSQVGADWEYSGGRIGFLGARTITYTLAVLPSRSVSNSYVGGGGSSEVFGGSSPASTMRTSESDYWEEITEGIEAIIPPSGSRYRINRANGTIILTAFEGIHRRMAEFIERENARLSRQVAVKVDVLAYSEEDGDDRSTSINGILNGMARGIGLTFASPPNAIDDAVGIGAVVLENGGRRAQDGSSVLIRALSSRGRVSLVDSVSVVAMNNSPTPISVMSEQAYLAGTTTSVADNGEEKVEAETGIVNNGINMVVTPRVMNGGRVNLEYTLNLSTLAGLEKFETDTMAVQLPEVETRNFMQTVSMQNGSTMVIAAYKSNRSSRKSSAPFNSSLWGFGGSDSASNRNAAILVLITPVVIERQNQPLAQGLPLDTE